MTLYHRTEPLYCELLVPEVLQGEQMVFKYVRSLLEHLLEEAAGGHGEITLHVVKIVAGECQDFTFLYTLNAEVTSISGPESILLKDEVIVGPLDVVTLSCDIDHDVLRSKVLYRKLLSRLSV